MNTTVKNNQNENSNARNNEQVTNNEKQAFIPFCKAFIIRKLEDYQGASVYGSDLAYKLTEGINADGSFTYSTYEAKEYIKTWWNDCADFSEYENYNFGQRSNPFDNPEAFTVKMVIEGCAGLLAKCTIIENTWNDEIELTSENIETITAQINELSNDCTVF